MRETLEVAEALLSLIHTPPPDPPRSSPAKMLALPPHPTWPRRRRTRHLTLQDVQARRIETSSKKLNHRRSASPESPFDYSGGSGESSSGRDLSPYDTVDPVSGATVQNLTKLQQEHRKMVKANEMLQEDVVFYKMKLAGLSATNQQIKKFKSMDSLAQTNLCCGFVVPDLNLTPPHED